MPLPSFKQMVDYLSTEQQEAFFETFLPGWLAARQHFIDDVTAALNLDAAGTGDPVALSAIRITQAVAVAARRKDLKALQAWENLTLRYMQEHALDEYVALPVPPRATEKRAKHDRHLILAALRERVATYLREYKPAVEPAGGLIEGEIDQFEVSQRLKSMVMIAFPNLRLDETKKALLDDRIEAHAKTGRPLAEIDPEDLILDGLQMLGVPRPMGQNWLKGMK